MLVHISVLKLEFVCISDVSAAGSAAGFTAGLAAALLHPGQPDGLPSQQTSAVSVRFAFRHQTSLGFFFIFWFRFRRVSRVHIDGGGAFVKFLLCRLAFNQSRSSASRFEWKLAPPPSARIRQHALLRAGAKHEIAAAVRPD
jgi:hypothetical protein